MKRIALITASAVLLLAVLAGCTQYRIIALPGGDDGTTTTPSANEQAKDTLTFMQALETQLPGDIQSVIAGSSVSGLEKTTDSGNGTRMAARTGSDTAEAEFKFTNDGYAVAGYGTIHSGTFTVEFQGTKNDTTLQSETCAMNFTSLEVTKVGETTPDTISITGLSAPSSATLAFSDDNSISKIENFDSFSLTQAISAETNITMNGTTVSNDDIADSNTSGDFAGGFGTEAYPYIIDTANQFMNIMNLDEEMTAGKYYYFSVTNSLDFSNIEIGIPRFRGEINFNKKTLTGISNTNLKNNFRTFIDDIIEGKIMNLEYKPEAPIPFAYTSGWTKGVSSVRDKWITSFENVNVYGTFRNVSNNISLYIIQAFGGALEFHNCVNYTNIIGESYNGVFLGGYPDTEQTTRLVFDNCSYEGTMIVKNAGFLVGNSAGYADEVIVTNCHNNGQVIGLEECGVYCGLSTGNSQISSLNSSLLAYVTGTENIKKLESHVTARYNENKTEVTVNDSTASSYVISGKIYTKMMTSSYEYNGTLLVSFEASGDLINGSATETFPVRQVVDYIYAKTNNGNVSTDENGNSIVTVGETTYYLVTETHPHINPDITAMIINNNNKHTASNLTYSIFTYDANGKPVGYSEIEV